MPELPEVEIVVRGLSALAGRVVVGIDRISRMRVPFGAETAERLVRNRAILRVGRRAKYIIFALEGGTGLLAHLGMTGSFRVEAGSVPRRKHDRAAIRLDGGDELRFADIRRFGFVKPVVLSGPGGLPEELSGLGPEPLERSFSGRTLSARAAGRKAPVKTFIMDQKTVVGVGNIYANEALFMAGIDPRRPAGGLGGGEWNRLAAAIKTVLRKSIRSGGSSVRDYRNLDGGTGSFQLSLKAYGRGSEACPRCGRPLAVIRQGGRSTFFCRGCQK